MNMTQPNPRSWHRVQSDIFADLIDGVEQWDAISPVPGWTAVDVIAHILVTWTNRFRAGGVEFPTPDPDDLAGSYWTQTLFMDELLGDDEKREAPFQSILVSTESFGALASLYVTDLLLHGWDLARATGQDYEMPEDVCEELFAAMSDVVESMRLTGEFGEPYPVPEDQAPSRRLLGLIGRNPDWQPSDGWPEPEPEADDAESVTEGE